MSGHVHTAGRAGLFTKEGEKTILSEKTYEKFASRSIAECKRKRLSSTCRLFYKLIHA